MKKKSIIKILAVFMLVTLISVSTYIFADVGNINRYDSGSSSSSSHSSSSSSYSGSSYSSSSEGGSIWGLLGGIVIVGIIVFVVGKSKGKINNVKDMTDLTKVGDILNDLANGSSNSSIKTDTKGIADEIRQNDPEFSEEKFLSWTKDVFV